ncbi:MAG: stage 0 sporulation family protein, partial [Oscillospiraceae bacterium]|jgi:cell fate regulator YaaT (PSP1 superfamily)|nr:stage 0 sporulation family protein [Oscillospiraceae bacterium]
VVVETTRGVELGECTEAPHEVPDEELVPPLRKVVRIATERDLAQVERNRENERRAYLICQEKIIAHNIEMKLVDVEYAFDNTKILFYFTANGRVDFRSLVKDLASVFKTRIELRQIGVRDEAKMLGGLGPCGRHICCGSFLGDFQPVSIKMAKEQNLSLNPTKISGLCGRLMCCLKYEQDVYEEGRKKLPRVGKDVITPDGRGHVVDVNPLKQTAKVRIPVGDATELREYAATDLRRIQPPDAEKRHAKREEAAEPEAVELAADADDEGVPEE